MTTALALALLLAPRFPCPSAAPRPAPVVQETPRRRIVAFVLSDQMELIELTGPGQIFSSARGFDEVTVAETLAPVHAYFLEITPQYTFDTCPKPDVIVFPGPGRALGNRRLEAWLRANGPSAECVFSVCNGVLVLAQAGLLDGRDANAGGGTLDELRILAPAVRAHPGQRFLASGNAITSNSYFAGVDGALHAIETLCGADEAQRVARWNLYEWDPARWEREQAEPGEAGPSGRYAVYRALVDGGLEAGLAQLAELRARPADASAPKEAGPPDENHLRWLAGTLELAGRHAESLLLLELDARAFPTSTAARTDLARSRLVDGECARALDELLPFVAEHGDDARARAGLASVLHDERHAWNASADRARDFLRVHPFEGEAALANDDEPGDALVVAGSVRDAAGRPVAGALVHAFQTDAQGHYTTGATMDEPHARLFAFVKTGADGRFELTTIRPGGYPGTPERQGVEWQIPCHVHVEVEHEGFPTRRFQLVFADDPRMAPQRWQDWARDGGHPVVAVTRDVQGVQHCALEVVLGEARAR